MSQSVGKRLILIVVGRGVYTPINESLDMEYIDESVDYHNHLDDKKYITHLEFDPDNFGDGYDQVMIIYIGRSYSSKVNDFQLIPTSSGRLVDAYELWVESRSRFRTLKIVMAGCNAIGNIAKEKPTSKCIPHKVSFFKDERHCIVSSTKRGHPSYIIKSVNLLLAWFFVKHRYYRGLWYKIPEESMNLYKAATRDLDQRPVIEFA